MFLPVGSTRKYKRVGGSQHENCTVKSALAALRHVIFPFLNFTCEPGRQGGIFKIEEVTGLNAIKLSLSPTNSF